MPVLPCPSSARRCEEGEPASPVKSTVAPPGTAQGVASLVAQHGRGPTARLLVGDELEMGVLRARDLSPVPYEGPDGIGALLERLLRRGGEPVHDGGHLIGLSAPEGHRLSIEPGGQLELSTSPNADQAGLARELAERTRWIASEADALGLLLVGGGLVPAPQEAMPWMPKGRYRIMRAYFAGLGEGGKLAHHMMQRTLSTQVTLDWRDRRDANELLRLGFLAAPAATAIFANSPLRFTTGPGGATARPSGLLSKRAEIWRFTDPARSGELPGVLDAADPLLAYVDAVLDVPMMFRVKDHEYHPQHGASFRRVLEAGRWEDGTPVTTDDLWTHLNGVFPDARLKRGLIELRSTDHQSPQDIMAVPAFWVGLLYDRDARAAALEAVGGTTRAERDAARAVVPRVGLAAPWGRRRLRDVALELVRIARAGLARRTVAGLEGAGLEGTPAPTLLDRTLARVEAGRSPAHEVLDAWTTAWNGDLRAFVEANRYRP